MNSETILITYLKKEALCIKEILLSQLSTCNYSNQLMIKRDLEFIETLLTNDRFDKKTLSLVLLKTSHIKQSIKLKAYARAAS